MATTRLAEHNLIAAFRDLEQAEEGLRSLHEEGFTDDHLSILGQPIDEVDMEPDEAETHEPIGGEVGREIAAGAAGGAAVGSVATALGAAAVAAVPGVGMVAGTGALIGAVSGAGAGSTVGAILGGEAGLRTDASWRQALEAIREGAVVLGVHDDDPDRIEAAAAVIDDRHDPMSLHRVDDRGRGVRGSDDQEG